MSRELHVRIGSAIERAAEQLPDGYEISIELERGSGVVRLFVPPLGDDEGGEVKSDWDCDFADSINAALEHAIEHHQKGQA
jgi:hypothetical protein